MDSTLGPERVLDLSGVWAAARFHRLGRNRRGPTRQPSQAKTERIRPEVEIARSRAGVRGAHSTGEGGEQNRPREGALLWLCVRWR
jgi:hypothetical protein